MIILGMRPANERRRYIATSYLTGWAHTQNHAWIYKILYGRRTHFAIVESIPKGYVRGKIYTKLSL